MNQSGATSSGTSSSRIGPQGTRWHLRAAGSRRKPRAAGVFHPVFGSLVWPEQPAESVADRAVAAAIIACARTPRAFRRAVLDLPKSPAAQKHGAWSRHGLATANAMRTLAQDVAKQMVDGDWWYTLFVAVVGDGLLTVRAVLRAAMAAGLTKRDLSAATCLGGDVHVTLLSMATTGGFYAIVEVLLGAGANPNVVPKNALSNLEVAIEKLDDDAKMAQLLVAHGARTAGALHFAATHRAFRCMQVLLAAGADVDEVGGADSIAPLAAVICAEFQAPDPEVTLRCVELLVDGGATVDTCGLLSPLGAAASFGQLHVLEAIVRKRGPSVARSRVAEEKAMVGALRAMHTDVVKFLLDAGTPIGDIRFALYSAVQQPSGTLAEVVLEHASESGARRARYTAAVCSVAGKSLALAIVEHRWTAATVRRVFAPHRDWFPMDRHGEDGYTALQRAVERGQLPMVRALLDCGADPAAKALDRRTTALAIAQRKVAAAAEGSVERRLAEAVCEQLDGAMARPAAS